MAARRRDPRAGYAAPVMELPGRKRAKAPDAKAARDFAKPTADQQGSRLRRVGEGVRTNVIIAADVEADLRALLGAMATADRCSTSAAVTEALREWIPRERKRLNL